MRLSSNEPNSNEPSKSFYLQKLPGPFGHGRLIAFVANGQLTGIFCVSGAAALTDGQAPSDAALLPLETRPPPGHRARVPACSG